MMFQELITLLYGYINLQLTPLPIVKEVDFYLNGIFVLKSQYQLCSLLLGLQFLRQRKAIFD